MITKQQKGLQFEAYVYQNLKKYWGITLTHCKTKQEQYTIGENYEGWEIKNDQTFKKTGNLYISVERRYEHATYPSGIFKDQKVKQRFYVIGDHNKCYVFSTKLLQQYYYKNKPKLKPGFTTKNQGTEYGFLLNTEQAERLTLGYLCNEINLFCKQQD